MQRSPNEVKFEKVSKLEQNAAIVRLIESSGADAEARELVVGLAGSIPSDKRASVDISAKSTGGSFSAMTPESGTVKIDDGSKHTREWEFGSYSERVGYYKISRKVTKTWFGGIKDQRIVVTHYWKADSGTGSDTEEPEAWCLACTRNMEPIWFGRFSTIELLHIGGFAVVLRVIHETWGSRVGAAHPHSVEIRASVSL